MTLKSAFKYQLADHKNSIIIFYVCIFAVTIILPLFNALMTTLMPTSSMTTSSSTAMVNGHEFAAMIFLFVTGLNSFSESFRMLAQNGISRKSMFKSRMFVFVVLAFGMAIIDQMINLMNLSITSLVDRFQGISLYDQIFVQRAAKLNGFALTLESTLFNACIYLAALGLGYFITIMYYRLNKNGKIAVSVGVPVGLLIDWRLLSDSFVTGGTGGGIVWALYRFIIFAFGIQTANPYASMTTFAISFIVLCGFGWLMMRRAVVKS